MIAEIYANIKETTGVLHFVDSYVTVFPGENQMLCSLKTKKGGETSPPS